MQSAQRDQQQLNFWNELKLKRLRAMIPSKFILIGELYMKTGSMIGWIMKTLPVYQLAYIQIKVNYREFLNEIELKK